MAPRPGAHNFEGIIHLHGALNSKRKLPGNYILSSRDFARVYLRSGVIGNYVYDLIRRYRVVLIGYSADDPPMRYLMDAIGEDASLFSDMKEKEPYAITDLNGKLGAPAAAIDKAIWKANTHAQESNELSPAIKKVWRLLHVAAKEGIYRNDGFMLTHNVKTKIKSGKLTSEEIDELIDCLRPRLRAVPLSMWAQTSEKEKNVDDPMRWVRWEFETSVNSSYQPSAQLTNKQLGRISDDLLYRLVERSTSALSDAIRYAEEIGWISDDRDFPNHLVHRIFIPENELAQRHNNNGDEDDRDPDHYNNNFAPIVRMLSRGLHALAEKNIELTKLLAERWKSEPSGLYVRLFAFASWDLRIIPADDIVAFLTSINSHAFWRWIVFPEIASLRALRWNDFPRDSRAKIEVRLLDGPDNDAFRSDGTVPETAIEFHRVHELARLVDNNCDVSTEVHHVVDDRRKNDSNFPARIPAIEPGLESPRMRWVPQGKPEKFADIPSDQLLIALTSTPRAIEEGDHAEAFARTLSGKYKIIEALKAADLNSEYIEAAWRLLLSYPHDNIEDTDKLRQIAEDTAQAALKLRQNLFSKIADQLCYWLDSTEERCPKFEGADKLWNALMPYAAAQANAPDVEKRGWSKDEVDLTMAALNEPLGHLLSMFLRRCPSMPMAKEQRQPLPADFVQSLKALSGRAKELLANRMAVLTHYFVLADKSWLEEVVVSPMRADGPISDRLWEAFAKYGKAPRPEIWRDLQQTIFRRLSSPQLSPEAKNQLAHLCVIVWIWSKEKNSPFKLEAGRLRSAFGLANDDVRASAAWQFASVFHSREENESNKEPSFEEFWPRIGQAFFKEIWPLEPALQSPRSANDFARIPFGVGHKYFEHAVDTILPYLLPFEVWAVITEFQLDPKKESAKEIVSAFPQKTLVLLAVCISENQQHGVYDLKPVLDWIVEARPDLQHDYRMRSLRKLAVSN